MYYFNYKDKTFFLHFSFSNNDIFYSFITCISIDMTYVTTSSTLPLSFYLFFIYCLDSICIG